MAPKNRIKQAQIIAREYLARKQAARREYKAWWSQWSTDDLDKMLSGEADVIARFYASDYERIEALEPLALTAAEKRELRQIERELRAADRKKGQA